MELSINKNKFKVKTVISSKDTSQGMMNKRFDNTFNGMLFLMGDDEHCFWMKNCIIPLDIIFIDGNTIIEIHNNCQPCTTEDCSNYCGEGDMILEIMGGTAKKLGLQIGDEVNF